jgi:hypothetical protein
MRVQSLANPALREDAAAEGKGDYSRCFQLRGMVAKLAALGKGFLPNK